MAMTKRQLRQMMKNDLIFASLVQLHGEPVAIYKCADGGNAGKPCMEGNCVNGRMLIMRCNESNGCDQYDVVPCTGV